MHRCISSNPRQFCFVFSGPSSEQQKGVEEIIIQKTKNRHHWVTHTHKHAHTPLTPLRDNLKEQSSTGEDRQRKKTSIYLKGRGEDQPNEERKKRGPLFAKRECEPGKGGKDKDKDKYIVKERKKRGKGFRSWTVCPVCTWKTCVQLSTSRRSVPTKYQQSDDQTRKGPVKVSTNLQSIDDSKGRRLERTSEETVTHTKKENCRKGVRAVNHTDNKTQNTNKGTNMYCTLYTKWPRPKRTCNGLFFY